MDLRASEDVKKPMALPSPFHSVPCADPSLDESKVPVTRSSSSLATCAAP